jgi:AbrB family looped-hinge helix DNA binding protein
MVAKRNSRKEEPKHLLVPMLTGRGKVSSKGWVVIPKAIRDELEIAPGDELSFTLHGPLPSMKQDKRLSTIRVAKVPPTVEELLELMRGLFPRQPGEPLWTEELLKSRKEDLKREERKLRRPRRTPRKSA